MKNNKILKNFLKSFLILIFIFVILYWIILALTYYQYNISDEFKDKKPIENILK